MRKEQKIILSILVLVLFVFPMLLSAQETTGTLRGFVTDKLGKVLPGVAIEISSPNLMGTRSTITDDRGFYRFLYLPPGKYTICAKLDSFGTCWRKEVPIQVAKTYTSDIEMEMAGLEVDITVIAEEPVIDTESSEKSYNLPLKVMTTVPIAPQMDYHTAWMTLPGVIFESVSRQAVNSSVLAKEPGHVQRDTSENKVTLDGMDIIDPLNGICPYKLNHEVFQEIDMKTAGAPAEYGTARSSFMNIITKSGGNDFHSSFLFQWKPESLVWTNVEEGRTSQTSYFIPSLTITGPVLKDKIWFLASLAYYSENYTYPDTVAVDKLVSEKRRPIPHFKLTLRPHKNHTISLAYQNNLGSEDPLIWGGIMDFRHATPESLSRKELGGDIANINWRWIVSNELIFNFVIGYLHTRIDVLMRTQNPQVRYYDRYLGNIVSYEEGGGKDYFSYRQKMPITFNLTWFKDDLWNTGAHEWKVGAEINPPMALHSSTNYLEDEYGYWQYRYALDYEKYGLTEPYLFAAFDVYPETGFSQIYRTSNRSFYIQDVWTITRKLSINFGLRWEHSILRTEGRDELPTWMETISPTIRDDEEFNDSGLAPRFGLTYNLEKIGIFKFHFGRYFEHIGNGYSYGPKILASTQYRVSPKNFGMGPEGLEFWSGGVLKPFPNHNVDLEFEYNDEFLASFERELFWQFVFDATFIYRNTYVVHAFNMNPVFENGKFVDYKFPDYVAIWTRRFFKGDERRTMYDFQSIQLNLKRNFSDGSGFLINFARNWRAYNRLKFDPDGTDQFVYAQPEDISRTNYGVLWVFHGTVYYRFPWDITLSTFISGNSGVWFNDFTGDYGIYDSAPRIKISNGKKVPDILWAAQNSYYRGKVYGKYGRRSDPVWSVNLRVQKGITVSKLHLAASIDFYNLFNWAARMTFEKLDIRNPRYNNKLTPQSPRAAQINIRVEF